MSDILWKVKLHARLHDPAEKALVLLRDPAGHEGGTVRWLQRELGLGSPDSAGMLDNDNAQVLNAVIFRDGIPKDLHRFVQRADWWAAAADRPQWPVEEITTQKGATLRVAPHAQVRFASHPVLIHPLTGEQLDLSESGGLKDTDIADIKARSFEHLSSLIVRSAGQTDWRRTLLSMWRFGPELREEEDNGKLGALWRLLPADTRTPDHSIWDHLDLTSAFAGAFAADPQGEVALLALSLGPVQGFIESARTTSDLWAGSHLLSRLAWEAMKPLCERLGPDAILFPRLRGVPQVDVWLRDEQGLPGDRFDTCDWTRMGSDANPLFAATLPNRLVAVVPASQARELALAAQAAVREFLQGLGQKVVNRLLAQGGFPLTHEYPAQDQARSQLTDFPEVHWAVVPFSLIRARDTERQRDLDTSLLSQAMAPFFGADSDAPCGFLNTPAWQVLQQSIPWGDSTRFFDPNPGVLYPAVHDLAERVLAAAKATRPFRQMHEEGWRCSLTGESEWLTTDREQLAWSKGHRARQGTLWTRIAEERPAWARKGEHLGALAAIKRLWPTLFAEEVKAATRSDVSRFVVSTHTMALVGSLEPWLRAGGTASPQLTQELKGIDAAALPRKLAVNYAAARYDAARRIPALLDAASEMDSDSERARIERLVRDELRSSGGRLETYYALVLMDGDRTGAWLSGEEGCSITYEQSFHPKVRKGLEPHAERHPLIARYLKQERPLSPGRHLAISGALNDFSQRLVPHVVEVEHAGRVIYAGGDDVLAMLPVSDLLAAMLQLRCAYSGVDPADTGAPFEARRRNQLRLKARRGFVQLDGTLLRLMGARATASIGAVIAHHQAPLSAVLRALRLAERRAKDEAPARRDAFSISVLKRSGGALHLPACNWQLGDPEAPIRCLRTVVTALRDEHASRRVAYHVQAWSADLPEPRPRQAGAYREMLQQLLAYQLERQGVSSSDLARQLAQLAPVERGQAAVTDFLNPFIQVAEFLAREVRGEE